MFNSPQSSVLDTTYISYSHNSLASKVIYQNHSVTGWDGILKTPSLIVSSEVISSREDSFSEGTNPSCYGMSIFFSALLLVFVKVLNGFSITAAV